MRTQNSAPTASKSESPYLLLTENAKVRLKATKVNVQIDGVIADVVVNQTYINEDERKLDAAYVFAGSTRAAVYAMEIRIGDRIIEAKVKEKQAARQEFEAAREQGKTAGLLEQHRPNVFQMEVANILPGDTVEVSMRYTETVEYRDAIYEFVYPGAVGPRYSKGGENWVETATGQLVDAQPDFDLQVSILSPVPVQSITCASHQISVEHPNEKQALISLANPLDKQRSSDFVLHYGLQGKTVQSGMMTYKHPDGEQFFMMMVQPPACPPIEIIPPREYIFIIDCSGSMHGFPLEIAKATLEKLISSLRPTDLFNVILFSLSAGILSDKSLPATHENIQKAFKVIDGKGAGGGTELLNALQAAFDFPTTPDFARTFVVITDGFVTVESQAFQMIREKRNKANVFGVGIGSNPNRHIIEGISYAGAGEAYFISNQTEADKISAKLIRDIALPVWTHISIDWDKMEVVDIEPSSSPDLFETKPLVVFGKYRNEAKGSIKISGRTGIGKATQIIDAAKFMESSSQALRYLWARNRIKYLNDYAHYFEDNINHYYYHSEERPHHEKEITELGLKYNLLTKYTSFIAVDDENYNRKSQYNVAPQYNVASLFDERIETHATHATFLCDEHGIIEGSRVLARRDLSSFASHTKPQSKEKRVKIHYEHNPFPIHHERNPFPIRGIARGLFGDSDKDKNDLVQTHLIKNLKYLNCVLSLPKDFKLKTDLTIEINSKGKITNVVIHINSNLEAELAAELKAVLMQISIPGIEQEMAKRYIFVVSEGKIREIKANFI